MYSIVKRYCENENTNGLMLLDMPTGSGKTYSVIKYIFDAVQDSTNTRKFFFITTLKKNLPEEDMRRHFEEAGQLQKFKDLFLRVDSNFESVISGFLPEVIKAIPAEIKKTDEYKSLEQYINLVRDLRTEKKRNLKSALLAAEDSLRKDAEPRFRRMLQTLIAKKFTKVEDRLQAIKTEKEWQWIAALYPSVFMKDRQIIFMSMDKFLSLNSTIVEPSTMLYNSDLIDNAVIFIDEFDATKETVLKNIIQNGLRDRVDYVELFNAVYSVLHTHTFPAVLTTPSKKRQEGQYRDQLLQAVLDKTIDLADEIHDMFSLQYSHRTETITDDNANNFLFQDHQYHSILNGNKSYITTWANSKDKINSIRFSNERPESDSGSIQVMLGKLRGFISYFMGTVRILAINYQQCKAERRNPYEDEFTLEEAIRTVLSEFKLSGAYINYLTSQILISSHKYKGDIQSIDFDMSFYEKGFRYYAFEDDYAHDMQSKIMMFSFQLTPEKLLLRFCEKAKVLGISATATIPSAIGNYDIDYLREKLQDKFISATQEETYSLRKSFEASVSGYDKVKIHTQLIGCNEYNVVEWKNVVDHDEAAQYLYDRVEQSCAEDANNYNKERYLRIAVAFKKFLLNNNIRSFLCVLTKHPRKYDKVLNLDLLLEIFETIVRFYNTPFDVKRNVVQLDGEEYDIRKDEIIKRLGNGERLFVISVYQTIGAGQNLQYPAPADIKSELVKVNDRPGNGEKDFDAIYLDMPTNLLTQLSPNLLEDEFVRYLFHIEMLQETAEISVKDATAHIKKAFRTFTTRNVNKEFARNINDCMSVVLLSTRVIIQAVGRICRTNLKSRDIYVFADSRIADRIDFDICKNRMFNCEFVELINELSKIAKTRQLQGVEELQNEAQLTSIRANKYINSMLRESWTDNRIACWKKLREMVLQYPTLSAEQFDEDGIAYNFYVEMPEENDCIFYEQEEDFNNVQVFFERRRDTMVVSADASKLTALMKLGFLKNYFEKNGWATEFVKGRFIMSPPLFNNIYRGALGEVIGKALFYKLAGVELVDIEENTIFEKFDFMIPNSSIFVDFKNWHGGSYKDSDKEVAHIARKAKECGCKCVFIANILGEAQTVVRDLEVDGVRIVVIPALLTNELSPEPVIVAWERIRRYIREYSN